MIGRLRGEIVYKRPPFLMVEVNGVGYELEAPMSTFYQLPALGQPVTLVTHLAIRDDAHVLYGFFLEGERALFRSLLKVSGVGAKMALAILSGMTVDEFARCVQAADSAALVRLPGIGKRTAERLIVEMRDRLQGVAATPTPGRTSVSSGTQPNAATEATEALVALGYKPADASRMVQAVAAEGGFMLDHGQPNRAVAHRAAGHGQAVVGQSPFEAEVAHHRGHHRVAAELTVALHAVGTHGHDRVPVHDLPLLVDDDDPVGVAVEA